MFRRLQTLVRGWAPAGAVASSGVRLSAFYTPLFLPRQAYAGQIPALSASQVEMDSVSWGKTWHLLPLLSLCSHVSGHSGGTQSSQLINFLADVVLFNLELHTLSLVFFVWFIYLFIFAESSWVLRAKHINPSPLSRSIKVYFFLQIKHVEKQHAENRERSR